MAPGKPKTLKQLQREWYRRLEKEGFVDIEQEDGNLKTWASHDFDYSDPVKVETSQSYYRLAGQFLHEHVFDNTSDRLVWEYHSKGVSIRDIPKLLKKHRIKLKKSSVGVIIQRLAQEMIIKCR